MLHILSFYYIIILLLNLWLQGLTDHPTLLAIELPLQLKTVWWILYHQDIDLDYLLPIMHSDSHHHRCQLSNINRTVS